MILESKIETQIFRDFLSAIPKGFDEAHIEITSAGLYLENVDRAHVLMATLQLKPEGFVSYKTDGKFNVVFDVMHIKAFANVLKSHKLNLNIIKDRKITMDADNMAYELQLYTTLNLNTMLNIPDIKFDDAITIPTNNFKSYIDAANKIGENTELGINDGRFYILSKTKTDKLIVEIPKEKMNPMDGTHAINLKSRFRTGHLMDILKSVQFLDDVRLNLKDKSVLKVEGGRDGIDVEYLLASLAAR